MSDPINATGSPDIFTSTIFPIASFVISISVAISFFASVWWKENKHQKKIKNIINDNVKQLTQICNRLYVDVNELHGTTESDIARANSLSMYFDRQITRLEMLRINIGNQLTHIKGDENYIEQIKKILESEDWILEKCNRPDIPTKYKLSLWRENQSGLQEKTGEVIQIAKDLKIIQTT